MSMGDGRLGDVRKRWGSLVKSLDREQSESVEALMAMGLTMSATFDSEFNTSCVLCEVESY